MIASAVPATGTLIRHIVRITPLQRALSLWKHAPSSCQDASNNRKIPTMYHRKITRFTGSLVKDAESPTRLENHERWAWVMKNSDPKGYNPGSAALLIAGT